MVCSPLAENYLKSFHLLLGWLAHDTHFVFELLCCARLQIPSPLSLILSPSRSLGFHCLQLFSCKFYWSLVLCVLDFQSTFQLYRRRLSLSSSSSHKWIFAYKFNAVSSYQTLLNCNNRGNFREKPKIRLAASIKTKTVLSVHKIYCFFGTHYTEQTKYQTRIISSSSSSSTIVVAVRNDKSRLKLPKEWIITW